MLITDLDHALRGAQSRCVARVAWEDRGAPAGVLEFAVPAEPYGAVAPSPEAFLLACFPLAAAQGERRIAIAAAVCPRLVEGLHTVHAWWRSWGVVHHPMPAIETRGRPCGFGARRRTLGFFSGGIDSLHMLLRNRALYERGDPGYIEAPRRSKWNRRRVESGGGALHAAR